MKYFTMHPTHPQPRVLKQVVEELKSGGLMVYPTDSTYALGCLPGARNALERIRSIRDFKPNHPLTLVCGSLSQIGQFAVMDNAAFRLIKQHTPGPFTFVLHAQKSVPRPAQGVKRRNIGVRIPDHPVVQALLRELDEPLLSSTLWLPGEDSPVYDLENFTHLHGKCVNLIVDAGPVVDEPTTVVDLLTDPPTILRQGQGVLMV